MGSKIEQAMADRTELRMLGSPALALSVGEIEASAVWKGENESDPELVENYDTDPLTNAEAWTEDEAYSVYRRKLVRLRDLYVGQLSHLRHMLQKKRRHFLLQQQAGGRGRRQASQSSQGGSLEDAAYRCYRKRSGEEALLERRQKRRRIEESVNLFSRKETRESNKPHYQHLVRLHQQFATTTQPLCVNAGCNNRCLPYASRCSRHICDDPKQLLYTKCSYVYPSKVQCSNPVPTYWDPPLCGGHCDNVSTPTYSNTDGDGCGEVGADGSYGEQKVEEGDGEGEIESSRVKEEGSLSCTDGVANRTIDRTADTCTRA